MSDADVSGDYKWGSRSADVLSRLTSRLSARNLRLNRLRVDGRSANGLRRWSWNYVRRMRLSYVRRVSRNGLGRSCLSGVGRVAADHLRGIVIATERALEVTKPAAQRSARLGQSLWSKHEQRDHKDEQQMRWLENVADHNCRA